ncbi:MAG: hypothetical protein KDJ69_04285 [Nitratireductor sp.]|nr:hypothetical protein [Nitratireductor sp.]
MSKLRKRSLKLKVDPLRLKMSVEYREEMGVASSVDENEAPTIGVDETKVIEHDPGVGSDAQKLKKLSG